MPVFGIITEGAAISAMWGDEAVNFNRCSSPESGTATERGLGNDGPAENRLAAGERLQRFSDEGALTHAAQPI